MARGSHLFLLYLFIVSTLHSCHLYKIKHSLSHLIRRRSAEEAQEEEEDLTKYLGNSPRDELAKVVLEKNKYKLSTGKDFEGEDRLRFLNKMGDFLRLDLGVDTDEENWLDMARNKAKGISNKGNIKKKVSYN